MKRKRHDSTTGSGTPTLSNKILCLQNGSNVEVQLDDGKWFVVLNQQRERVSGVVLRHSGTIVQCQARKYLVQVEEQQYWSEVELIRSKSSGGELGEKKRTVPFEYRPGQFLRNESKSPTKIITGQYEMTLTFSSLLSSEEKVSPSSEPSTGTKKKKKN